ncbi:glycosyl transferase [Zafaria cholistanensis]|uniref:Glycosyl transferase n=1 Tax=Zafaria cholistanensis TaxID=1682741 RepID=A0A5A7NRC2_9MICC|nr:glycosyl transferase [Zafaria cholistanensis]
MAHPAADLYGSDRVLLESVQGLLDRGNHVAVALPGPGPLVDQLRARGAVVEFCPTPVLRKSLLSPLGLVRLAGEGIRGLYRGAALVRRHRPDALYVSTVTIPLWPLLGRLAGIRTVIHVHEAERHAARPLRVALALPLLLAHRIVANSLYSVATLEESLPALRGRATVVYNGVPGPEKPVPARAALNGALRVLYVGRLSHRKGVDVAVEAVAELRRRGVDATLDVVGAVFPGYEDFERALRDRVEELGLGEAASFHGFQPGTWDFLASADAVVVPSRLDEPFGNTAVEAVLAARPVVVSDTSGLREAAAGYSSARFAAPGNAEALADALAGIAAEWDAVRAAAAADASVAGERHAPERYRLAIAGLILGPARGGFGGQGPEGGAPGRQEAASLGTHE